MQVSENAFQYKKVEKIEEKKRYFPPTLVQLDESMTQLGRQPTLDGPISTGSGFG